MFTDQARTTVTKGQVDPKWVKTADPKDVAKLEIVEHLRNANGVKSALSDFHVDDSQITVSFKGPGYTADAFIDRDTGKYDLTVVRQRDCRRPQRPAQGARHRNRLVENHRRLGKPDDAGFADRAWC